MKKGKKNYFKFMIIVIIIITIIGIIIYKNNSKQNTIEQQQEQEASIQQMLHGEIDMNNTENAKIEDGIKKNTSENILRDRKIEGIEITNINLEGQGGISDFTATVKNNTSKNFEGGVAKITFTNKDGSTYAELEVFIPEIKIGGENTINAGITADIINAYDFSIKLEK